MALVEVSHGRKRWLCYAIVESEGLSFVGHDKYSNRTILWNDIISFKLGDQPISLTEEKEAAIPQGGEQASPHGTAAQAVPHTPQLNVENVQPSPAPKGRHDASGATGRHKEGPARKSSGESAGGNGDQKDRASLTAQSAGSNGLTVTDRSPARETVSLGGGSEVLQPSRPSNHYTASTATIHSMRLSDSDLPKHRDAIASGTKAPSTTDNSDSNATDSDGDDGEGNMGEAASGAANASALEASAARGSAVAQASPLRNDHRTQPTPASTPAGHGQRYAAAGRSTSTPRKAVGASTPGGPQHQGAYHYHHERAAMTGTATVDFVHAISHNRLRRMQYTITAQPDYLTALADATRAALSRQRRHRRHFLFLVNPVSGRRRGARRVRQLLHHFHDAGITTTEHITREAGEARRLLSVLDADKYQGVVVVGGDGFLNEAVLGLMTSAHGQILPVGTIPAGSTNTVARSCYGTDEPLTCALHAIRGKEQRMDACRVQGQIGAEEVWTTYALNFVSSGFFSETLRMSEGCRCCGPARYQFAGVRAFLANRSFRATVTRTHDEVSNPVTETVDYSIIGLALMSLKAPDTKQGLVPHAVPGSGAMHQLLVRKSGRFRLLRFLRRVAATGSQFQLPYASCVVCKTLEYKSESPRHWNVDGELLVAQDITATLELGAWIMLQWDDSLDESAMVDCSALSESYPLLSREQSRRTYRIAVV